MVGKVRRYDHKTRGICKHWGWCHTPKLGRPDRTTEISPHTIVDKDLTCGEVGIYMGRWTYMWRGGEL